MTTRRLHSTVGVLAVMLAAIATLATPVSGASDGTLSMDVATFAFHSASTELDADCPPAPVATAADAENHGTVTGRGAWFASVNLPDGARIRSLRLSVRDNDTDFDTWAHLIRKRLAPAPGYDSTAEGYKLLASRHSTGASMLVRRFSDSTVLSPTIDTSAYAYLVEIVNCADTVDPLGVQLTWSRS